MYSIEFKGDYGYTTATLPHTLIKSILNSKINLGLFEACLNLLQQEIHIQNQGQLYII